MKPIKETATVTKNTIVVPVSDTTGIIVSTNVEILEPVVEIEISEEEAQYLEKEFLLKEEKNQYYDLAYSQY